MLASQSLRGFSSAPSPPSLSCPTSSGVDSLQKVVSSILVQPTAETSKYHMDELQGHRHSLKVIHMSDGSRLMLKMYPSPSLTLLRHERRCLNAEALTFSVLAKSKLPIPRVLKHDHSSTLLGSPFLLTTYLPGITYSSVRRYLTRSERSSIERQLKSLASVISQHTSHRFGPVALKKGYKTWREAFLAVLELALMDGEDRLVHLPYDQIRAEAVRFGHTLDDVKEGRLVILGFGSPENVLIDRRTNEVTGLTDFGRAMWGDATMIEDDGQRSPKNLLYALDLNWQPRKHVS